MNVINWELGDWDWTELVEILFAHRDAAVVVKLWGEGLLEIPAGERVRNSPPRMRRKKAA